MANQTISVVVPIYNEESNLKKLFEDFLELSHSFERFGIDAEFILIDDCSNDKSWEIITKSTNKIKDKINIRNFKNESNIGFASTILKGFSLSSADFLMILPGDAEVDIKSISNFDIAMYDLIIYERKNISSRPPIRILLSYLYRFIICLSLFQKPIDFNGIYIVRKEILKNFKIKSKSFFVSAEIVIKSMMFTKNFSRETFDLFEKPVYKSSSLGIFQFFGVSKNFIDLTIFRISILFK